MDDVMVVSFHAPFYQSAESHIVLRGVVPHEASCQELIRLGPERFWNFYI